MLQRIDIDGPNAIRNIIQRPRNRKSHQHANGVDMLAAGVVILVEAAREAVDDGDDGDEPSAKGTGVEAALVPVWTAWMSVVEGGDVDVAFADDEVVGAI